MIIVDLDEKLKKTLKGEDVKVNHLFTFFY